MNSQTIFHTRSLPNFPSPAHIRKNCLHWVSTNSGRSCSSPTVLSAGWNAATSTSISLPRAGASCRHYSAADCQIPEGNLAMTTTERIKLLLQHGEADRGRDRPDQLQYGLVESDIPALLNLLADEGRALLCCTSICASKSVACLIQGFSTAQFNPRGVRLRGHPLTGPVIESAHG